MHKLMIAGFVFASATAITATVTLSAPVMERPAAQATRLAPCPVAYHFKGGFCIQGSVSKKTWFATAIDHILR